MAIDKIWKTKFHQVPFAVRDIYEMRSPSFFGLNLLLRGPKYAP